MVHLDRDFRATVTVIAENQVISQCLRNHQKRDRAGQGGCKSRRPSLPTTASRAAGNSWSATARCSIWWCSRVSWARLTKGQIAGNIDLVRPPEPSADRPLSVLSADGYQRLIRAGACRPRAVHHRQGARSFKGSGFVRGGLMTGCESRPAARQFYLPRYRLPESVTPCRRPIAPTYDESGIFIVRGKAFSAAYPFRISSFSATGRTKPGG